MAAKDSRDKAFEGHARLVEWLIGLSFAVVAGSVVYAVHRGPGPYAWIAASPDRHLTPGKRSPVVIVGGSISPWAAGGWDCAQQASSTCVSDSSIDVSQFSLIGVTQASTSLQTGWLGQTKAWRVILAATNGAGNASNNGVSGVVAYTGKLDSSGHAHVTISAFPPDSSHFLLPSLPSEAQKSSPPYTFTLMRYRDLNDNSVQTSFYEHIWGVEVLGASGCSPGPNHDPNNACIYLCPDGQCDVSIGPPQ